MQLLEKITSKYEALFSNMVIKPGWEHRIITDCKVILAGKKVYEQCVAEVNPRMPWYFVGIVHFMECSGKFDRHLHNGDSLKKRTWRVPVGRPIAEPKLGFPKGYTWLESAADALSMPAISYHVQHHWTLHLMLYRLEKYNGFGYIKRGICTPYLWSGTNHYTAGKFDSDGHYDSKLVSSQTGAAVLLRYLTDKTLGLA